MELEPFCHPRNESPVVNPHEVVADIGPLRAMLGSFHTTALRITRMEKPSQASTDYVRQFSRVGAELAANLISNPHNQVMPVDTEIAPHIEKLRDADRKLFPEVSSIDRYSVDRADLLRTLQAHALGMDQLDPGMNVSHRMNIEDSTLAISDIISAIAESNRGLALDVHAQEDFMSLLQSHEATPEATLLPHGS